MDAVNQAPKMMEQSENPYDQEILKQTQKVWVTIAEVSANEAGKGEGERESKRTFGNKTTIKLLR